MRGDPIITLNRVSRRFGRDVLAVDDVSLTINQGDFITFLGPSGCGKSTALKMIAGLLPVSSGTITITPPQGKSEQDLAFVFQEPTLMPWATVFDNVYLPLRLAGVSRAQAEPRVRAVLVDVGLSKFEKSYPRELSGGMKMRVSIARAMVTEPRLLLMDEPFAALDEMTRFKLNNDTLALWQSQQFTTIFVTHSVYESVYLSNRIVVMAARPGRVVAEIAVNEPYPRSDAFRNTARYAQLCVQVSQALQQAGEEHG